VAEVIVVLWVVLGLVFFGAMASFVIRARREVRADRPAPLESSHPREAVRAAIERRER
jgi:beta-lactamase regulating signal transducer with metallopeptidase domain